MYVVLRRLVLMALVGAAGFAGYTLWRRNTGEPGHTPEWPPLTTPSAPGADAAASTNGDSAASTAPTSAAASTTTTASAATGAAAGDTAEAPADASVPAGPLTPPEGATWVPAVEGECPIEHPIKANDNSGIYHVPGGRFYDRTRAERCYARPEDADADGYRPAKA